MEVCQAHQNVEVGTHHEFIDDTCDILSAIAIGARRCQEDLPKYWHAQKDLYLQLVVVSCCHDDDYCDEQSDEDQYFKVRTCNILNLAALNERPKGIDLSLGCLLYVILCLVDSDE